MTDRELAPTRPVADVEARLVQALQDAELATQLDPAVLAVTAELVAELAEEELLRRSRVFSRIAESLARLRQAPTVEEIIARAACEAAEAADFDRVVVYRVDGSRMLAEATHVRDDPGAGAALLALSREHTAALEEQTIEREMVRRRRPAIVRDAQNHPDTFKELVVPYGTHSYVAAPIMPEGRVIGFVHADNGLRRPGDPDGVDELDRDALFAFSQGLGTAVERCYLATRVRAQGDELRRLLGQLQGVLDHQLAQQVELATDQTGETEAAAALFGASPGPRHLTPLSSREQEVLELLAEGATNAEIGDRLVITEATVKSHVKRILRKLGASNRVEAATIYVRALEEDRGL